MRRLALLLTLSAALAAFPAAASAAPLLHLDLHHAETNGIPGGSPGQVFVSTTTQGSPTTSEVQQLTIGATTGTFQLHFGADVTAELPSEASAATVQSALRALPSIGSPNVTVIQASFQENGTQLSPQEFIVFFGGPLANTDLPKISGGEGVTPLRIGPELWVDADNLGNAPTTGTVTLAIQLPAGIRRNSVRSADFQDKVKWNCPGSHGDAIITCTTAGPLPRHSGSYGLAIALDVDPALVPGTAKTIRATLSGGGAAAAPPAAACAGGVGACASEVIPIAVTEAPFGLVADTFRPDFTAADEVTPVRQTGAHPDRLIVPIDFNSVARPTANNYFEKRESDSIRDLTVDLPPGFLGDPTALSECPPAALNFSVCPRSSQVGIARVRTVAISGQVPAASIHDHFRPVFNMEHPKGAVADLAFSVLSNPVHIRATLDPSRNYAITSTVSNINETLASYLTKVVLWGVPADPSHDAERCNPIPLGPPSYLDTTSECSAGIAPKAFLTTPFQCETEMPMTVRRYDSWQHTGTFGPDITHDIGQFSGCDQNQAQFAPDVSIAPTNTRADTPTGLNVTASVSQSADPGGVMAPPVKRIQVKLPKGMTVNPSFADGLEGCTEAQIGISHAGVPDASPVTCPDASRIGAVELNTPLLPTPAEFPADCPGTGILQGSIYLARQEANPENSLFAVYVVVHDCENRGVLVKIPGSLELDPASGQITTNFDDLPQFPVSSLSVQFRSGDRAPLINPPTCGPKTIAGTLDTWAAPAVDVPVDSSYQLSEGPGGGACSSEAGARPFAPTVHAGTTNPLAGAFSPFVLGFARQDGEQELTGLSVDLPPGLLGKLAGLTQCSDASIASIPTAAGTGAAEKAAPTCPAASRVGRVNAGSGAGPQPFYIPGSVYYAGPYKGAAQSIVVVTPAVAGGIDLGNVVIRSALYVDPGDSHVRAVTDPLPTVLHGVPIHLRDVRVVLDRPEFTLNPTNCSALAVRGQASGSGAALIDPADDSTAAFADRFQVGGCDRLPFKPSLAFSLKGGTHRGDYPALTATLHGRPGDANIGAASVALPHSEFLAQEHIKTLCTRVQFAASACPAGSIYGSATARTPLFSEPLSGPVILRSSSNPLPDMVAVLKGPASQPIEVDLVGRIDSVKGGIRNTFDVVPDAPVETFTLSLLGGKKGLLVNSTDLCKKTNRAIAHFTGQNGKAITLHPALQSSCKKPRKKKAKAGAKHHKAASGRLAYRLPRVF